jgi:release factor glutamine methyltransferase
MRETVDDALRSATRLILDSPHVDLWRKHVARSDAEDLMADALKRPKVSVNLLSRRLEPDDRRRFDRLVGRRVRGEPVALIRGWVEFSGLRLRLEPGVFTPRYSTELLATEAVRRISRRRSPVAVDVATGAGAVALAVAHRVRQSRVWGLDISKRAVKVARRNSDELGLRNARFRASDMLQRLPGNLRGEVDIFTIHPPYVARAQMRTLPPEIKDYEPAESLTDRSVDGLGLVRRLAVDAPAWLKSGGWVLVEVAPDLSRAVQSTLRPHGFDEIKILRDSLGATRVVAARLS